MAITRRPIKAISEFLLLSRDMWKKRFLLYSGSSLIAWLKGGNLKIALMSLVVSST